MRNALLCLIFIIAMSTLVAQAQIIYEDFENLPYNTLVLEHVEWEGSCGGTWVAKGVRLNQTINGKALCFAQDNQENRYVESPEYGNGMGTLRFKYAISSPKLSGTRRLRVFINDVTLLPINEALIPDNDPDVVSEFEAIINKPGPVILKIKSTGQSYVKIDDIEWTSYNPTLPVELSHFSATVDAFNHVYIAWVSQTETNLIGYYIYRAEERDLKDAQKVSDLIPATNTSNVQFYTFSDTELEHDAYYYYWLQSVDISGEISWHGPVRVFWQESLSDQGHTIPMQTKLMNAYPNPFNPVALIPYQLQKAGEVRMDVFNLKGQKVRSFSQIHDNAGFYSFIWDGLDYQGISLASGVYLYRMSCEGYCEIKRLVLKK